MPIEYAPQTKWPLTGWRVASQQYTLHDAWYAGDASRLAQVYSTAIYNPFDKASGLYSRQAANKRRSLMHVPVAGDISGTSAAWLFGEHPKVTVSGANDEKPVPAAVDAQKRMNTIIEDGQIWSRVSEAAECCSAMGGVVVKVDWDDTLYDYPILSIAQADATIPEFRYGQLVACEFWKEVENDGTDVLRFIERREKGYIYNALYKGKSDEIGSQIPLDSHKDTYGLQESISTGIDDILCRYVPNLRPNRMFRKLQGGMDANCLYIGQSDYSGSESIMESLDETYTSLLRDIRLGAGKLNVPLEMMVRNTDGTFRYDYDEELFIFLDAAPSQEGKVGVTATQFEIRTQQHLDAANALYRQIVTNAGYSPQSFGLDIDGQAESGTALSIREGKTVKTTARKADYWKPAMQDIFTLMLKVDRIMLKGKAEPLDVAVEMQDGIKTGITDIAPSLQQLAQAGAVSTEVKVRMLHPDYSNTQVMEEAAKIQAEMGVGVADPTQFGVDGDV